MAGDRKTSRSRGGFTLLEFMIAMTLLVVGLIPLAAMQIHAMRGGGSGRHATQAAAIAQSQMEQFQRLRWTNADLADTSGWTTPATRDHTVQGDPDQVEQSYAISWRITDLVADLTRSIDVRVTWDEPDRPNRSVTLSTIRFNYEGL